MPALPKEITQTDDGKLTLTEEGHRIVKRGGADGLDDDTMLIYEILHRAPGMFAADLQKCFVAMRMEYGDDSLRAIRTGHVQFEARKPQ